MRCHSIGLNLKIATFAYSPPTLIYRVVYWWSENANYVKVLDTALTTCTAKACYTFLVVRVIATQRLFQNYF